MGYMMVAVLILVICLNFLLLGAIRTKLFLHKNNWVLICLLSILILSAIGFLLIEAHLRINYLSPCPVENRWSFPSLRPYDEPEGPELPEVEDIIPEIPEEITTPEVPDFPFPQPVFPQDSSA